MRRKSGFTLIEMSIVLVIIGLIVGGILVGQDLIASAAIRSQISQIERYNTAVNTFRNKYGYLPGDMPDPYASQFGFSARGTFPGLGDGNGIIQGTSNVSGVSNCGFCETDGEVLLFWVDLSKAGLIDGSFSLGSATTLATNITSSGIGTYIPPAKIGQNNSVYIWSGGSSNSYLGSGDGNNYFGISNVSALGVANGFSLESTPGLTVKQAANIDKKIDDGMPQAGKVMAWYINYDIQTARPA